MAEANSCAVTVEMMMVVICIMISVLFVAQRWRNKWKLKLFAGLVSA